MGITLGVDVGTVSAKWALIGPRSRLEALKRDGNGTVGNIHPLASDPDRAIAVSRYQRVQGRPLEAVMGLLSDLFERLDPEELDGILMTGSAGKLVAGYLGLPVENEFKAAAIGVGKLFPDVENIFEMGGENSKFIHISNDNGVVGIVDYETNGDCAAGTGSFMDQQASRLRFSIEDVGDLVLAAERLPKIAGRCSVFAKSDMIHAQQKGYRPEEVLKGLCEAVARNFKSNIARGKDVHGKTAFIGGVALNGGVAQALRSVFELGEDELFIPDEGVHMGAIGAALLAETAGSADAAALREKLGSPAGKRTTNFPALKRLTRDRVQFLRNRVK